MAHMKHDDRYDADSSDFNFHVKLKMSQIMVEAFARSLIDKIMLEAFDVVDPDDEKLRMLDDRQESADIESRPTRTTSQMNDRSRTDRNEPETIELIEKMVRGLHNLQIGDSTSVTSPLSALEKQVKHAVCSIGNITRPDSTETHVIQGQGDVHRIIHDAVIETTSDITRTRQEKESSDSSEATRSSVNLLHRMIEELETKVEESVREKENESESVSKERIAVWEETEEQFIRTIESVDNPDQSNADCPAESGSKSNACEFTYEELTSSPATHSVPYAKNIPLEDVAIEEIVPSPLPSNDDSSLNAGCSKSQKKSRRNDTKLGNLKKRNILDRMRKLLRTIFGRRKK